jgi:SP family arabinose:H+ symporter-like MFS transporter
VPELYQLNSLLIKSAIVGALGGLLFGFDTAVISGATHQLTQIFALSAGQLGFTVSIALVGTVVGALGAGPVGQRIGSRDTLRWMALLYIVSAVGSAFSWSWASLLVFRFIGGLGIGGSSVLGPVYIAEMAPARMRGRMVGLFQINIVAGILLAYASNYGFAAAHLGNVTWRCQLGIACLPALLFFIMLFGVPRSSRWLLTQDRIDEARTTLGLLGSPDSEAEVDELRLTIRDEAAQRNAPLFTRKLALPIFLAVSIGIFNQFSGINAILYYLSDIFRAGGFSSTSSDEQSVIIGTVNLISTLLAVSVIDRIGRKPLLLIGSVGTGGCLAGVAYVFMTHHHLAALLWLLIGFIFFFAISQGAVVWVYISEVFPTSVRAKGQSLGSSANWIANAVISFAFPVIAKHSSGAPFIAFAVMMFLQFPIVLFLYPETKGFSLENLQDQLSVGTR